MLPKDTLTHDGRSQESNHSFHYYWASTLPPEPQLPVFSSFIGQFIVNMVMQPVYDSNIFMHSFYVPNVVCLTTAVNMCGLVMLSVKCICYTIIQNKIKNYQNQSQLSKLTVPGRLDTDPNVKVSMGTTLNPTSWWSSESV